MVMRKGRRKEERFERVIGRAKSKPTRKRSRGWDRLTEGWIGSVFYIFLGVGLALVAKQMLAFGLSTDMPVVAVVSQSMQHDHAQQTYYGWLENNLGYGQEYIKSWPVPTGFFVGDMPIVQGAGEYEVGDVVVYSIPCDLYPNQCKYPTIHRIIKINEDGTYQTKGDNNPHQLLYEFRISGEQIHGRVIFIIPKLGYFKVILTNGLKIN